MSYSRIRLRRGTAYEWSTYNPILEEGELAVEYPDAGIGGFCKLKLGDGSSPWNTLGYAFDGTSASSIDGGSPSNFHVIKIRAGKSADWAAVDPIINENEIVFDTDLLAFKVGNGIDKFSDLPFTNSGSLINDTFDCGDIEDDDTIYSSYRDFLESDLRTIQDMPDSILPNTAGIDELLPGEGE